MDFDAMFVSGMSIEDIREEVYNRHPGNSYSHFHALGYRCMACSPPLGDEQRYDALKDSFYAWEKERKNNAQA